MIQEVLCKSWVVTVKVIAGCQKLQKLKTSGAVRRAIPFVNSAEFYPQLEPIPGTQTKATTKEWR
jgi:hypothetical protein